MNKETPEITHLTITESPSHFEPFSKSLIWDIMSLSKSNFKIIKAFKNLKTLLGLSKLQNSPHFMQPGIFYLILK